ncbi:unnamed protein product, partial [Symbiodinium necroappetens]
LNRCFGIILGNQSLLDAYAEYACGDGRDYFVTDPARSLNAELAPLEGGCINVPLSSLRIVRGTTLKAKALEDDQDDVRLERQPWPVPAQGLPGELPAGGFLAPAARTSLRPGHAGAPKHPRAPPDGVPALTHRLPATSLDGAGAVAQFLHEAGDPHFTSEPAAGKPGLSASQILEVPLTDERPAALLCAKSGRSLHLWRVGSGDSEPLPKHPYQDRRIDGDLWHRLIDIQVGPEISDAIAQYNGFVAEPFAPRLVLFLQRCTDRRILQNEQAALAAISSALIKSNRTEELVSMCAGRADFLEQAWKVRQARLIVGAHGGAMANMVLARSDAGIIELVGDAAAQKGLEGLWPPYKSNFYGGLGASFPFYRVVLYEADPHGRLWIRLDDLQTAVTNFLTRLD